LFHGATKQVSLAAFRAVEPQSQTAPARAQDQQCRFSGLFQLHYTCQPDQNFSDSFEFKSVCEAKLGEMERALRC
jgi:hypothetical protein